MAVFLASGPASGVEYTTLGSTGMEVSRICLGGMSFGSASWRD